MDFGMATSTRPAPKIDYFAPELQPSQEDLDSPLFNAIWNTIKAWDIEREPGIGYAHATGTDVMLILKAIKGHQSGG